MRNKQNIDFENKQSKYDLSFDEAELKIWKDKQESGRGNTYDNSIKIRALEDTIKIKKREYDDLQNLCVKQRHKLFSKNPQTDEVFSSDKQKYPLYEKESSDTDSPKDKEPKLKK